MEGVRHLAELGVVFLLFNIGLELSLERLRSMQKYVFGMGTAQVRVSHITSALSRLIPHTTTALLLLTPHILLLCVH